MGQPLLGEDPRFATNELRCLNGDPLDELLSQWFKGRTLAEAMRILEEADVVAGPVYDMAQIFTDAHYAARKDIVEVKDPDLGTLRMPAPLPKFSRTPGEIRRTGGRLGEGNQRFFGGRMGLTAAELERLTSEGVL
jgi:crotonobetainyl-CoA:carnitine CoA-transferase CaiB-like acyl-CoA transferase